MEFYDAPLRDKDSAPKVREVLLLRTFFLIALSLVSCNFRLLLPPQDLRGAPSRPEFPGVQRDRRSLLLTAWSGPSYFFTSPPDPETTICFYRVEKDSLPSSFPHPRVCHPTPRPRVQSPLLPATPRRPSRMHTIMFSSPALPLGGNPFPSVCIICRFFFFFLEL